MTDHLIIQLTYPEFHFEIETEVDSLTGLQRYEGDYFEWILTIFKYTLPWTLNSLGGQFSTRNEAKFFSIGLTFNLCNSRYVCSLKKPVPIENTILV